MARYHITALNYMNVGSKRAFFNIDTKLDYDVATSAYLLSTEQTSADIRTESELSDGHLDPDVGSIIRVYGRTSTKDADEKIREFREGMARNGVSFVAELGPEDSQFKNSFSVRTPDDVVQRVCPMYDVKDVSIKSTVLVPRNERIDAEDGYQNIFAPDMAADPVGFCQVNTGSLVDTYLMTESTQRDPYMFSSQLKGQRKSSRMSMYYDMKLESQKTNMLTYIPVDQTGYSSYQEFIRATKDVLSVFEPHQNLLGVEANYILDFPDSNLESEYNNVHADIIRCKNPLNATYSVDAPSSHDLSNARVYCGIGTVGNQVYLKYYDEADYVGSSVGGRDGVEEMNATRMTRTRDGVQVRPYQKVEFLNKNKFTNKCKHKSNLFSVRITDLQELSENASADGVGKLRQEIYAAVNEIVRNVCPVNTQLFKVYFGT